MELGYGEELELYREGVRDFLSKNWPPPGKSGEEIDDQAVRAFRRNAVEAGYLYRAIPRRYGGAGREPDLLEAQIIREEFRRARAPMEIAGISTQMLVPTLLECGEEWQKERFVRRTIEGEIVWCQGYSEPGSGSDLASVRTRGELVDGEWVVNGQKIWTTQAAEADYMFALVRTEPDAPKREGISYLLLDMKQPGIEVRPLRQITGGTEFNEVFLDDARTPADWIVGERGRGWQVSRTTLKHERNMVGNAESAEKLFRQLVRLARSVDLEGGPAIDHPEIQIELARLWNEVLIQRYSGYYQLSRSAKGKSAGNLTLMNKLAFSDFAQRISDVALKIIQGDGLLEPGRRRGGNEKWLNQWMGSLGLSIAGGTSNIQRNIIAERGLGLPRDVVGDR